jgi:hypothetical protein
MSAQIVPIESPSTTLLSVRVGSWTSRTSSTPPRRIQRI